MKHLVKKLYHDKFKRYLIFALIILGVVLLLQNSGRINDSGSNGELKVDFFYHPNCHFCQEQKPFNEILKKEYPDVKWEEHDISNPNEAAVFREFALENGIDFKDLGTPTTFIGDNYFIGYNEQISEQIKQALQDYAAGKSGSFNVGENNFNPLIKLPFFGEINIMNYSLPVLAIVLGLVDGFNPCAMWVLVYLISLIISINDRKKIWLLVGSFVFASGVLYFLFMTAWLNVFLLIGYLKPITIVVGLFALGAGISDLKTYVTTRGKLECDVGDLGAKKKTISRMRNVVLSPLTLWSVAGIIGLAFVVNSIEFACSAAIPAIFTQVLALSNLPTAQYYLYILLYDIFFMLDDIIIFGLAAFAVNSTVGHKYARHCKLIGGIVLVVLGVLLTFAPGVLR